MYMIPKDPVMLLSWVNTQLRDHYSSLEDLCKAHNLDMETVISSIASMDYQYDPLKNQFI